MRGIVLWDSYVGGGGLLWGEVIIMGHLVQGRNVSNGVTKSTWSQLWQPKTEIIVYHCGQSNKRAI